MTETHVALLRGVNLGPTTRVSMADLRELFEGLGFHNVRTLLNSGNIIFSMTAKERGNAASRIEKTVTKKLGVKSRVTVLSAGEMAAVVGENPLNKVAKNPSWLLVVVPNAESDCGRLKPLLEQRWHPEALELGSRAAYLWCANGVASSPLWAAVEKTLQRTGTARNIATMTKLLAMVAEPG